MRAALDDGLALAAEAAVFAASLEAEPWARPPRAGLAPVRLAGGGLAVAEVHWYEGRGLSGRRLKIKRLLACP